MKQSDAQSAEQERRRERCETPGEPEQAGADHRGARGGDHRAPPAQAVLDHPGQRLEVARATRQQRRQRADGRQRQPEVLAEIRHERVVERPVEVPEQVDQHQQDRLRAEAAGHTGLPSRRCAGRFRQSPQRSGIRTSSF